jgi:hypothetical protein
VPFSSGRENSGAGIPASRGMVFSFLCFFIVKD